MNLATLRKVDAYVRVATRILGSILLAIFVAGFCLILWYGSYPSRLKNQIKLGAVESQVFQVVGSNPRKTLEASVFCDRYKSALADHCAAIRRSGSVRVHVWYFGVDTVLAVAVNASGQASHVTVFDL